MGERLLTFGDSRKPNLANARKKKSWKHNHETTDD